MRPFIKLYVVKPTDARGWIGLGCWMLVLLVLAMVYFERELLNSDAFLIIATAIVITGWVQGPVGWAYQATKGGSEAAESSARIAEEAATAAIRSPNAKPAAGVEEAVDQVAEAAVDEADSFKGNS